jgi:copper chaperone
MEKAYFKVVGMYCISCKSIVETELTNESGIKRIDVDYMTDSVIIEFDPSVITKKKLKLVYVVCFLQQENFIK